MIKSADNVAGLSKRGDIYWARFRARGKLIQESLGTKCLSDAKRKLGDLKAEYGHRSNSSKARGPQEPEQPLIDAENNPFKAMMLKALHTIALTISKKQARRHRLALNHYILACNVSAPEGFTWDSLIEYASARQAKKISNKTINMDIGQLKKAFTLARKAGYHSLATPEFIRLPHVPEKERRALTISEVEALIDATKRPQEKLMWRLFVATGMRLREVTELTWSELKDDGIELAAGRTKTRKSRKIPLCPKSVLQLRNHKEHQEYVFTNTIGNPWRNNLLTRFYKRCRDAGIQGAHPCGSVDIHALRGTFATHLMEAGADLKSIQDIVGHSTADMIMKHYARMSDQSRRDAAAKSHFFGPQEDNTPAF